MTTKQQRAEEEALRRLRDLKLQPGDTIYTALKHVAPSGMTRWVDLYVMRNNEPCRITFSAAELLGRSYDYNRNALKVPGVGFDAGFDVVYALGRVMFRELGFECIGERCPSNDHSNGDRDYSPHMHSDPGYAFNHRWLG